MEPLTAFSVCGNIITVVDAAIKAGKTLKELSRSPSGMSRDAQQLRDAAEQLEAITKNLDDYGAELSDNPHEPRLLKIAEQCGQVSKKIKDILLKCKVQKQGSFRSTVIAWGENRWNKSELERLQADMESSREQLQTAIAAAAR